MPDSDCMYTLHIDHHGYFGQELIDRDGRETGRFSELVSLTSSDTPNIVSW